MDYLDLIAGLTVLTFPGVTLTVLIIFGSIVLICRSLCGNGITIPAALIASLTFT